MSAQANRGQHPSRVDAAMGDFNSNSSRAATLDVTDF